MVSPKDYRSFEVLGGRTHENDPYRLAPGETVAYIFRELPRIKLVMAIALLHGKLEPLGCIEHEVAYRIRVAKDGVSGFDFFRDLIRIDRVLCEAGAPLFFAISVTIPILVKRLDCIQFW